MLPSHTLSTFVLILLTVVVVKADSDECVDLKGQFNVSNKKTVMRRCPQIRRRYPHLCNTKQIVKDNCPLSCGICGPHGNVPSCTDVEGKFQLGEKMKSCDNALNNSNLCRKQKMKKKCPISCGLCEPTFMKCPLEGEGPCCNGLETNCDLKVDEMLFATLHNANSDGLLSNHNAPMEKSLDVGYRGFFLDVCRCQEGNNEVIQFCHGSCLVGKRDPTEVFTNIESFLSANPTELVVFNFQMSVGSVLPTELWSLMSSIQGISEKTYVHNGGNWPTMGTLINDGKQIISFQHEGPLCPGGVGCVAEIPQWFDYTKETDYDFNNVGEVENVPESCHPTRGVVGEKDFYSVNNFVTGFFGPVESAANTLNGGNFLKQRILDCENVVGDIVNFVNIDFWQKGDLPQVTQDINSSRASAILR